MSRGPMVAPSASATNFWRDRGPDSWARILPTYWESQGQPHRAALIEGLRLLPRFDTVRELGCCAGTNLALIRRAFPWVSVEGIELSVEAATFAQDKLVQEPQCRVVCTDMVEDAPYWADREADVVVSCYALAYIPPETLHELAQHIIRSARVGVVLVEPMHNGPVGRLPVGYAQEWRHDYQAVLDAAVRADGRSADVTVGSINTPVELCDGIAVVAFR